MRYGTFALSILFQSTLSVRRATTSCLSAVLARFISIHALRKESDLHTVISCGLFHGFQSTLSVRRATLQPGGTTPDNPFQSTLSVRRATPLYRRTRQRV